MNYLQYLMDKMSSFLSVRAATTLCRLHIYVQSFRMCGPLPPFPYTLMYLNREVAYISVAPRDVICWWAADGVVVTQRRIWPINFVFQRKIVFILYVEAVNWLHCGTGKVSLTLNRHRVALETPGPSAGYNHLYSTRDINILKSVISI
jgi:hypothetical protein